MFNYLCLTTYHQVTSQLNSLVPNSESGSRQWPLLSILLPDILFLGHRGMKKLLLCKMYIRFLS